jgi:hypothetical protein
MSGFSDMGIRATREPRLLLPLPVFLLSSRRDLLSTLLVFKLQSVAKPGSPASGLCSLGWDGEGPLLLFLYRCRVPHSCSLIA